MALTQPARGRPVTAPVPDRQPWDAVLQARWAAHMAQRPGMPARSPYVLYRGPFYSPGGYTYEARTLLRHLLDAGFTVRALPPTLRLLHKPAVLHRLAPDLYDLHAPAPGRRPTVELTHLPACWFRALAPGAARLGRTMFETDRLPPDWVRTCRRMDEVWVPSTFNAETFADSGVPARKIRVLPLGVDTRRFHPGVPPLTIPGARGFVFLANFAWQQRKGWPILVEAFLREFHPKEDVTLVLKTLPVFHRPSAVRQQLYRYIRRLGFTPGNTAPIILDQRVLPREMLPRLYAASDAFVLPTRGEGWGFPFLEAMACGKPVIGTAWSSLLDFLHPDYAYLLEIEGLEPVRGPVELHRFYRGHRWAKPSVDHLRQLLRHVFEHPGEARAKGARARAAVEQRWDVGPTAARLVDALARWVGDAPGTAARAPG
ncbi:MAG TPA: glycosyltransferase [Limnochordales bacterium]|nr:glycosyltransferase [Limnochordales bacterium]